MAFSKVWKDKEGKNKEGVKVSGLKNKPKYTPEPLKPPEPKKDTPIFGKTGKDDK